MITGCNIIAFFKASFPKFLLYFSATSSNHRAPKPALNALQPILLRLQNFGYVCFVLKSGTAAGWPYSTKPVLELQY